MWLGGTNGEKIKMEQSSNNDGCSRIAITIDVACSNESRAG